MRAMVVYESIFGHTEQIAKAIGEGLRGAYEVAVLEVADAAYHEVEHFDMLVVGGPTQMFGMSRGISRGMAKKSLKEGEPVSKGIGFREWLDKLPKIEGVAAAAFDTRAPKTGRMPTGAAAKGIAAALRRRGARLVAGPEGFFVEGADWSLVEGELDRATEWARSLIPVGTGVA